MVKVKGNSLSKIDKQKLEVVSRFTPKQLKELFDQIKLSSQNKLVEVLWEPGYLKAGFIWDTHLWAKEHAKDALWEFYDKAKDKWAECVFHSWDLIDWENVYKWQIYELLYHWADDQIKNVVENYPDVGIPTYFINGNHDESFLKTAGIDTWNTISWLRNDLKYLWFYDARIKINGIDIDLHHWWGSKSYAISYKPQKYLENCDIKNQPDIYCYDDITEVLTLNGWKLFKDIVYSDKIATLNHVTRELEYQVPTDIVVNDNEKELIKFKTQSIDLLVSPKHRMYVQHIDNNTTKSVVKCPNKSHIKLDYNWHFETAEDILNNWRRSKYRLNKLSNWIWTEYGSTTIKHNNQDINISQENMAKLLWWYISEWSQTSNWIQISQSKSASPIEYETIASLLNEIWIKYTAKDNVFNIYSKGLSDYFKKICYVSDIYNCEFKCIPDFIKNSNKYLIWLFIETLFLWDGSHLNWKIHWYYTTSKQLIDDVQECILKLWLSSSIKNKKPIKWFRPSYRLIVQYLRWEPNIQKKPERMLYNWKTYCVTVPNSIICVRRNWIHVWCWNCLWHYHDVMYMLYRWIHSFMPGSFLKENLLAKRFKLSSHIWWWMVEIEKNPKWQSMINMEFLKL